MAKEKNPKLFLYSILLPVIWLALGATVDMLAPEIRLGVGGLIFIIYGTLAIICWRFAKEFKRYFTRKEKIRLVVYFTVWAVLCESLALLTLLPDMDQMVLLVSLGVTTIIDTLIMSLGVHFISKRLIGYFLKKDQVEMVKQA
ncbi:ABZJ_00895 family protein [Vibrio vulnificus]|nr:hypothetical protein [Vibrio vulnificus]EHZ2903849.1 ABZJ_00895 family protein [Vibrio vulnificus]EIA1338770.1 ABZJ_00895 family protein [Vibrio vulnificus]EIA1774793.1 ABZJ_00895 family protein [Vibrio vulnificus]EIU7597850.1 ABZJ_00895 family protein [Vibrio vulnificus]